MIQLFLLDNHLLYVPQQSPHNCLLIVLYQNFTTNLDNVFLPKPKNTKYIFLTMDNLFLK